MKLFELLLEALKPSQYRKYVKGWDKDRYKHIFKKYTNDPKAYRIYLPLKGVKAKVSPPHLLSDFLNREGYVITDYLAGIAVDMGDERKVIRIGKLLSKMISLAKSGKAKDGVTAAYLKREKAQGTNYYVESVEKLLKQFNEDPKRKNAVSQDYWVVISRHPYDIAGMSTGRGWRSCMNLDSGMYKEYVAYDVDLGSIIAYVVKDDDKNINHPVGRLLIKPFFGVANPDQVAWGIEDKVYGTDVAGFKKVVEDWVDEVNESEELDGIFEFSSELYDDGLGGTKIVLGRAKELKENPTLVLSWKNVKPEDWPVALKYASPHDRTEIAKRIEGTDLQKSVVKAAHKLDISPYSLAKIPFTDDALKFVVNFNREFIPYLDPAKLAKMFLYTFAFSSEHGKRIVIGQKPAGNTGLNFLENSVKNNEKFKLIYEIRPITDDEIDTYVLHGKTSITAYMSGPQTLTMKESGDKDHKDDFVAIEFLDNRFGANKRMVTIVDASQGDEYYKHYKKDKDVSEVKEPRPLTAKEKDIANHPVNLRDLRHGGAVSIDKKKYLGED